VLTFVSNQNIDHCGHFPNRFNEVKSHFCSPDQF
jgi:hypothetical protein